MNLSQGAKRMSEQGVIVKKLNAIENFGSMTVMCSDKTGTITQGKVKLDSSPHADSPRWIGLREPPHCESAS